MVGPQGDRVFSSEPLISSHAAFTHLLLPLPETIFLRIRTLTGFPGGSDSKQSAYNTGDLDLTPGWGRSSGEGNDNPFQYSCLENSMNREPGGL